MWQIIETSSVEDPEQNIGEPIPDPWAEGPEWPEFPVEG